MNKEEMIEKLSGIEHDRWCSWQRYLHSCCIKNQDGSLTIPKILVERWEYELNTKYKDLPDNIKESDRKETYKIIPIIEEYLQHQLEEKDKIINKVSERLKLLGKYDGETCTRNFKMMSADFNQLLKILERGKNEK